MNFTVLSATSNEREWDGFVAKLPPDRRDVHFTSAYARVQQNGGEAILFVATQGKDFILQPMIKERVPFDGNGFDLRSLYGFGGPIASCDEIATGAFHNTLIGWAVTNNIISEYCCLHPMLAKHQLPLLREHVNIQFGKDVVVIEELPTFSIARCRRRVRRSVRTAVETGAYVIDKRDPVSFARLYTAAMHRLDADDRWKHDLQYWQAHVANDVGAHWFYLIRDGAHRALLTVGVGETAYAHFLGSDGDDRYEGYDEFLYVEAATMLGKIGYRRLHLGGGLTERIDDPLLMFKKGFSSSLHRVGSYARIFDQEAYDYLSDQKKREEKMMRGRVSQEYWFPQYRRPFA